MPIKLKSKRRKRANVRERNGNGKFLPAVPGERKEVIRTTGAWPVGHHFITSPVAKVIRKLRAEIVRQHGECGPVDDKYLATIAIHLTRQLRLTRVFVEDKDTISTKLKMELLREIGKASDAADDVLEKLDLSERTRKAAANTAGLRWAAFYAKNRAERKLLEATIETKALTSDANAQD